MSWMLGVQGPPSQPENDNQRLLVDALAFRDQVMGILGHDLRNPLSAIVASAGLLLESPSLSASLLRVVERLERAARRMSEMIATLLDFTQVRGNRRLPLSIAPADLAEVSRAVIDELRIAHRDRTIALRIKGDARGLWDAARMGQVISNLVGNALQHGAPDAPVNVVIEADGDELTLRVHNHGRPIAPELVPTLFAPFRRGHEKRPEAEPGLGLGLFIAKQIVLAHAGEVRVESTPTAGTSFIVRLPQHGADALRSFDPAPNA